MAHTHLWVSYKPIVLLYHSLPHLLETGTLTEPGPGLAASAFPSRLYPYHSGVIVAMDMTIFSCWGFELRSLRLQSKCSYLLIHLLEKTLAASLRPQPNVSVPFPLSTLLHLRQQLVKLTFPSVKAS